AEKLEIDLPLGSLHLFPTTFTATILLASLEDEMEFFDEVYQSALYFGLHGSLENFDSFCDNARLLPFDDIDMCDQNPKRYFRIKLNDFTAYERITTAECLDEMSEEYSFFRDYVDHDNLRTQNQSSILSNLNIFQNFMNDVRFARTWFRGRADKLQACTMSPEARKFVNNFMQAIYTRLKDAYNRLIPTAPSMRTIH
ncbi:MAG: hypothetical protein OXB84_04240, partial [Halobacteriovoraceae bacterium]|nr:hypothetical protein [Halobacteriovoraceae bacterium]